jgi:hypothetical protein
MPMKQHFAVEGLRAGPVPMTSAPPPNPLNCSDALRRRRHLTARTTRTGTHVVLRVPPGETALLTPDQARALSDHLTHLADQITPSDPAPADSMPPDPPLADPTRRTP